jgi:hypothetical protein
VPFKSNFYRTSKKKPQKNCATGPEKNPSWDWCTYTFLIAVSNFGIPVLFSPKNSMMSNLVYTICTSLTQSLYSSVVTCVCRGLKNYQAKATERPKAYRLGLLKMVTCFFPALLCIATNKSLTQRYPWLLLPFSKNNNSINIKTHKALKEPNKQLQILSKFEGILSHRSLSRQV